MKRKIKVFLGGYINSSNAQNLNCRSIAKFIDKNQFEIKAMTIYSGNLNIPDLIGVKYIKCIWPHKTFKYITYLRGILWCDIAYLPKNEINFFNRFLLNIFKKKSMLTIEGIFDNILYPSEVEIKKHLKSINEYPNIFSITEFIRDYNLREHHFKTEKKILYLGCEFEKGYKVRINDTIQNIIFIGNDFRRKGLSDFLSIAKKFPKLKFHIIGGNNSNLDFDHIIKDFNLKNIIVHGLLIKNDILNIFKIADLHYLPSKSEGFPKVILETANAGIPSILYPHYGCSEWIDDKHNGFIAKDKNEVEVIINDIISNQINFKTICENSRIMARDFDWEIKIKDWETVFSEIVKN